MTHRVPSEWNKHLMRVYHELKKKNKNVSLRDAMKVAKRSYK